MDILQDKIRENIYSIALISVATGAVITAFWLMGLNTRLMPYIAWWEERIVTDPMQTNKDTQISQYNERANASRPEMNSETAASGSDAQPKAPLEAAAAALVPGCSLSFSVTPNAKLIAPGGTVHYIITLTNKGRDVCKNVSFSVYYPANEAFVSANPKASAGNYYWIAGTLNSGATYSVFLTTRHLTGSGGTQIENEACATGDNSSDVCADNLIFVQAGPAPLAPIPSSTPVSSKAPAATPIPTQRTLYTAPAGKEFGTWIWDSPVQMAPGYADTILTAAQTNGFNAVYVTIDDFLAIAALPAGNTKTTRQNAYMTTLSQFITLANKKGIAVDVEGGAKDWANSENRWKGYALIDFVKEYNQKYPATKIRNFQYDVEPYLLSSYETNKVTVLKTYLGFIDESAVRMQGTDAGFTVVIPHFYDSFQKWTPSFVYQGITGYPFTQLLKILEKKPGSTLIIMAYRDYFDGSGGTRDLSEPEIKEASKGGYSTNVIVAQETGNVDPDYVTFYKHPKSDLYNALDSIYATFAPYPNFGGAAVHYIDAFLELK